MKTPQQHAQEILPLVTAQANGEVIQMYVETHGWIDCKEPTAFVNGCKYRIKPKMILVNGFEVSEPMREAVDYGKSVFVSAPSESSLYSQKTWQDTGYHYKLLHRGLCHSTKEAAIAHAKAMLGIDPNE